MLLRILLALGFVAVCSAALECHLREVDTCLASLAVFARRSTQGLEEELNKKCEVSLDLDNCLRNYTGDCMTEEQEGVFDYAAQGVRALYNELCTEGTDMRADLLTYAPCMRETGRRVMKPCMKDLKVGIETIINAPMNKRFALGCCTYNRYRECSGGEIESDCGQDARDFMRKANRMVFSRWPEIACAEFVPGSDACADLPEEGSPLKGQGKAKPVLKIISKLLYASERRS